MPTSSTGSREYVCVPFITKKFNNDTKDTALGKELISFLNTFKNITSNTSPSDMADYKEGNCQYLIVTGCLVERYEQELREEMICEKVSVDIPLLNGGDIPYVLTWQFKKINEVIYMDYSLSGSTASRKLNREDRPGQYAVERDQLTSPYIKLKSAEKEKKIYIGTGKNTHTYIDTPRDGVVTV